MPTNESLRRVWLETEYRVRLPRGGYAAIRIGTPLPDALRDFLHDENDPWGFITAWNPHAQKASPTFNRARQRELREALQESNARYHVGIGVGDDWREPSLFVAGLDFDALDALARRFEQAAIVRGSGYGTAELRELD
ncbi:MAG TPA: DUF3293 domain-containing protein [Rhodanobacteraceae bacterium]|nr:DUF3293 domain-containing protein [Rhodanobacteraceae bacterium]